MKRKANYGQKKTTRAIPYPNAASKQYKLNKILDYLLTAATSFGVVTILIVFTTFF